jgi:hypothetical protein
MLRMVDELVPRLLSLKWTLEVDPKQRLITSDTPIVVWRKPTRMDDFEGSASRTPPSSGSRSILVSNLCCLSANGSAKSGSKLIVSVDRTQTWPMDVTAS